MNSDEARAALIETLEQLGQIVPTEKSSWDAEPVVRLAVERLWITAGNVAEEYRRIAGVDVGTEPWAELAGYRNRLAHALPGDVSTDRIWADTTADLVRILAAHAAFPADTARCATVARSRRTPRAAAGAGSGGRSGGRVVRVARRYRSLAGCWLDSAGSGGEGLERGGGFGLQAGQQPLVGAEPEGHGGVAEPLADHLETRLV